MVATDLETNAVYVIELTCPFETNFAAAHNRKWDKYSGFVADIPGYATKKLICVEVGARGKLNNSTLELNALLNHDDHHGAHKTRINMSCAALLGSQWIYHRRNETKWVEKGDEAL